MKDVKGKLYKLVRAELNDMVDGSTTLEKDATRGCWDHLYDRLARQLKEGVIEASLD